MCHVDAFQCCGNHFWPLGSVQSLLMALCKDIHEHNIGPVSGICQTVWGSELAWVADEVKSDLLMMSDAVPCLPFLAPQSPVMALCKGKGLMVVPSLPVSPHCLLGYSSIIVS